MVGSKAELLFKKKYRKSIRIPVKYLRKNRSKVILVGQDNKAHWQAVKIGTNFGNEVEIIEGIKPKDRIAPAVDFPIPGSPPSKTTDPGTNPPPQT